METNDTCPFVLVTLKDHSQCKNCLYKLKATLAAHPDVISVDIVDESNITAIVTECVDVSYIGSELEGANTNMEVLVQREKENCDFKPMLTMKEFNNPKLDGIRTSFDSKVVNCVEGSMGRLYNDTYKGVVRVTVADSEKLIVAQGTAFVVCKKKRVSLLLTCAHIFPDIQCPSIDVVTSDFKPFEATIWHRCKALDVCVLKVKGDLGAHVSRLKVSRRSVNFGDNYYSISCPAHHMYADDSYMEDRFPQTLWFTFTKGYVSHPFSMGGCRNMDAEYLQLSGSSWGDGSSGAPVLNAKGKVIGMYEASSKNSDGTISTSWATRSTSIADYFVKLLQLEKEKADELSLMGILYIKYRADTKKEKEIKSKEKQKRKRLEWDRTDE